MTESTFTAVPSKSAICLALLRANGLEVSLTPDSAVEGEHRTRRKPSRSERNGPVPLSAVAGIGAMSGVLNRCERSAK